MNFSVLLVGLFVLSMSQPTQAADAHHGETHSSYHGQLLCSCDDAECIEQRFHQHTRETGLCLAGLALEAPFPGHGSRIAKTLKCAVDAGITIYEVYERLEHCKAAEKQLRHHKTQWSVDDFTHCIVGSLASSNQMTMSILGCTAGIEAGSAITSCSFNIATGLVKVGDNAVCLGKDLQDLNQSKKALARSLQKTLTDKAPRGVGPRGFQCNRESDSCNTFGMAKFGIWLGQQTYWTYNTRSYLCADMCGNKGRGSVECKANVKDIFNSDAAHCGPVCNTQQCDRAVDLCVSYCCNQDSGCVDSSHSKMNYYNLN